MDPMLEAFLSESRENLDAAAQCFLALEKAPGDSELLNDLFRSMHTVKGASGLFDIIPLTRVVHAAEDLLDVVRTGDLVLNSELVDLFLDCMDQVSTWLDCLESEGALPSDAESVSQKNSQLLRAQLTEPVEQKVPESSFDKRVSKTELVEAPEWLTHISDEARRQYFSDKTEQQQLIAIAYRPESNCFFTGDDPVHTVLMLPGLNWFEVQENEPWPTADSFEPYHCNIAFNILVTGSEDEVRHHLRYVSEQVELVLLSAESLIFPAGECGDSELFSMFCSDADSALHAKDWVKLSSLIRPLLTVSSHDSIQCSALLWLQLVLAKNRQDEAILTALCTTVAEGSYRPTEALNTKQIKTSAEQKTTDTDAAEVEHLLQVQMNILTLACADDINAGRISSILAVVQHLFEKKGWQNKLPDLQLAAEKSLASNDTSRTLYDFLIAQVGELVVSNPEPEIQTQTQLKEVSTDQFVERRSDHNKTKILKVDQARIDILMDLVGELVVAKNALPFLAKRAEEEFSVRPLAKEIKAQYAVINRLSEELQSAMMQVRMVSISSVFQRFPRLVRDLSRKLNKQIDLVMEGEDTEADKNIVEELPDPLIHIIRNSLDHGLETADVRIAMGKPATGKIILRATQLDDQVQIDIIDDGKGIDTDVIKRKAYESGLISEEQLEEISDKEVMQLIFAPGLSAAESVSDLSGRGVGMDVVRTVISKAGGSIDVASERGKGTTISLRLPLSMAISRVMMIEVGGQNYGVYMDMINETVRVPKENIKKIKQEEAIVLRHNLIPLFRMRDILGLREDDVPRTEEAVIVVTLNGEKVGLVIDDFHEGIDIILKPLEGVMASYGIYSGTALLGDGRVLLVLNLKELLL